MKLLLFILLFGYCFTQDKSETEIQCICRLGLTNGIRFGQMKVGNQSLTDQSAKCDRNDFDKCAKSCNEQISTETNQFDLTKPKAGDQQNISFGQLLCDKTGGDVSDQKIILSVTLRCYFHKEILTKIGDSISTQTAHTASSTTRYVGTGFKQNLTCIQGNFVTNSTV